MSGSEPASAIHEYIAILMKRIELDRLAYRSFSAASLGSEMRYHQSRIDHTQDLIVILTILEKIMSLQSELFDQVRGSARHDRERIVRRSAD